MFVEFTIFCVISWIWKKFLQMVLLNTNFQQVYLIHKCDPNKYYPSRLVNLRVIAMKGYFIFLQFHHQARFSVIYPGAPPPFLREFYPFPWDTIIIFLAPPLGCLLILSGSSKNVIKIAIFGLLVLTLKEVISSALFFFFFFFFSILMKG